MGKVEIKCKKNTIEVTNHIKQPEMVYKAELELINKKFLDVFVALNVKEKKKHSILTAKMVGNICGINMYFAYIKNEKWFIDTIKQIVDTCLFCMQNNMDLRNLDLSPNGIFFDRFSGKVWIIYWPIINNEIPSNAINFFRMAPQLLGQNFINYTHIMHKYCEYFEKLEEGFSLKIFRKFLEDIEDDQEKPKEYNQEKKVEINTKNLYYDPILAIQNLQENASKAFLIRKRNNERIEINKQIFRIGKSRDSNEYTIFDNGAVSRIHAEIIYQNGKYYFEDCGSTNKSYINGQMLAPNTRIELQYNDIIKLADEEFSFYIDFY